MKEYHSQHVKDYKRRLRQRGEIIKKIDGYEYSNAEKASIELVNRLKPTHFVTIQLKQRRKIVSTNGLATWARGDDVNYCKTYRSFMGALSKRTQQQTIWRKQKLMIGNVASIEGGIDGKRYHFHIMLTKPSDMSEIYFRDTIRRLANENGWAMRGKYAVKIMYVQTALEKINTTFYSAKRGLDRILIA
jgi:hypothetical protein